jgi:hypothetical protein
MRSDTSKGASEMQTQTIEKTEKTLHTCVNCGHTGDDLVGNYYWVGGQGDVLVYECRDCLNARWEASQKACEVLRIAIEAIARELGVQSAASERGDLRK